MLAVLVLAMAHPIRIAHRGASGYRPEHTLAAYELAMRQGADYVEPDVVITKDGELVCRHENEISETTDVAQHPEFAGRKATKVVDGQRISGWFTEDFTLAELKTFRVKERLPLLRPESKGFDGQESIPTLTEMLQFVKKRGQELGRNVGIYPETKHPSYFRNMGLPLEERLVKVLDRPQFLSVPVFIQSFEVENLKQLKSMTKRPLIQLIDGSKGTYENLITDKALAEIATYAAGIGPAKSLVIPLTSDRKLGTPTDLVERAHRYGLQVHIWTFRKESNFLPKDPGMTMQRELKAFLDEGVDGYFTDFPDVGPSSLQE